MNTLNTLSKTIPLSFTIFILLLPHLALPAEVQAPPKEYTSVEQRRLDQMVSREDNNILQKREELTVRKKSLKTLEDLVDKKLAEIDKKLEKLKKLQSKIEDLLAEKSAEEKKRIKGLASIYEKMSPEKSSMALSGLDQQLAADLLANMKIKAAAKILDQISDKKATQLSTAFSTIQLE